MPLEKADSAADRAQGVNINTWPLPNGDLTLLPDDLLRGRGNLADKNADGQPDGMKLIPTAQAEGRNVYAGLRPDVTTRQNSALTPIEFSSYQMNHDMVDGDPAPGAGTPLALLPTPGKPTVVLEPAEKAGYPLAAPDKPHWMAFGFEETGRHSDPGPPTSFTGGQGQSYRVTVPEEVGEATTGIDIWMAEPGTSTASTPGPMRLQYTVDIRSYFAPTFDMTGPYRYETDVSDEVGALKAPILQRIMDHRSKSFPRIWYAAVMAVMRPGNLYNPQFGRPPDDPFFAKLTPLSQVAGPLEMPEDTTTRWFGLAQPASEGIVRITRPALPPDAKGWIPLVYDALEQRWELLNNGPHQDGSPWKPVPVDTTFIEFTGRKDSGQYQPGADGLLTPSLPSLALKVTPPDFKPEAPLAFDASRLPPGHYYFRVTEESSGLEGPVSPYEEVDVGDNDIPRIIFDNPKNRIPNATFREKDASGLPLSYAIDTTGGSADVVAGELLVQTDGVQTGTTPTALTAKASVDPTQEWTAYLSLKMENPPRGSLAGSIEAVLRQLDVNGTPTDTVLGTLSAPGEYVAKEKIRPTGSVGTYVWSASTVEAQLLYRFSGASKNALMRISRQNLKGYSWFFRRRQYRAGPSASTNVPPEAIATPGTDVALEPPPPVPLPPAGEVIPDPDRPYFTGEVLESFGFEPGLPAGWTQNVVGSALLDTNAAAALSGSLGLRLRKTAGGTLSSATLSKTFTPAYGLPQRHDTGSLGRYRVQSLSSGHYLDLHPLTRPSDGSKFAWLRYANAFEQAELAIDSSPSQPGNVTLNLGGVATDIAVVAVKETATLSITGTPTTPGLVQVSVGGVTKNVALGGTTEEFTLRIDTRPTTTGYVVFTVNGVARRILVGRGATQERVAQIIAAYPIPGYTVTYSGRTVRCRAVLAGPRTDPTFDPGTTGVQALRTMVTQGSIETASALAQRIRETNFPGFTTSGTGTSVDFTAIEAGPKPNASYNPGSTGATGTMNTTQEGSIDTPSALAARIRGTTISGWTLGGSGNVVTIIATTVGQKQDASYDPGPTGALGTMKTLVQGSSGDLSAVIKDAAGNEYHRKMLTNIGTTIFNADITVSGAGAEDDEGNSYKEAIINFFVSTGTSIKARLGRFEGVDLTDYPAGRPVLGVVAESSSAATWEVHVDDVKITDRGETYWDEHDYKGALLNQAYYNGVPDQPLQNDVFIVGEPIAVIPGEQVTFRARARWDGVPSSTPAKPLFLVGRIPEELSIPGGEFIELGDILGGAVGISGTSEWSEPTTLAPITIPENCFEVSFASRDMSAGEIVIQQIASSVGTAVKRTPLYATNGTYRASLSIPSQAPFLFTAKKRKFLRAIADTPEGTAATIQYRSGNLQPDESISWDSWQTDSESVADKSEIEVEITMTGSGVGTPTVPSGSPVVDYAIILTNQALGTLLKADGSEIPGGILFQSLDEWEDLSETIVHPRPGGDFDRASPYPSVPKVPPSVIYAFTPEGKAYLRSRWGKELLVLESRGEALTIKTSGVAPFKRLVPRLLEVDGQTYSAWQSEMAEAVIVERKELP